MQPVGTDDEVEFAWGGVVELDVDAPFALHQSGDGVSEDRLDSAVEAVIDRGGEIRSKNADISAAGSRDNTLGIKRRDPSARLMRHRGPL